MSISAANLYYFVIVAKNDNPIYEAEFMDSAKVRYTILRLVYAEIEGKLASNAIYCAFLARHG